MEKKENLRKNVQELCEILNKNNFRDENGFEWQAGSDPRSTFGGGICFDKEAFHFLKKNGHLDRNLCWKCGEEPVSNKYTFTDGFDSTINYKICSSCYGTGNKIQNQREGKGSGNCYIATVCYEDINAPEVQKLRLYRDEVLSTSKGGLEFINFYYTYSPKVAEWMKDKRILNKIIKTLILNPIVKVINLK